MTRARDMANIAAGSFSIPASSLVNAVPADGSITTAKLASGAITSAILPSGSVLQVLQTVNTTQQTINAGNHDNPNFQDIGMSLSITPSSTSSKIYLMASVSVGQKADAYNNSLGLFRGSTLIGAGLTNGLDDAAVNASWRAFNQYDMTQLAINFLDSPSTTSAITYAVKCNNNGGSTYPAYINRSEYGNTFGGNPSSTFTLMEIAG